MKSMNTKKIAALAAGAALLGGALLGAVSFENTELINSNGQVMAKIVVGEKAAASDGVAAANIAAVLGNHAFKKVAVSATPTGLDALTCSGTGAGTCEVLSKSVTLEVTTPAGTVPAGAFGFKTLITDYVDSDLENRINTGTSDKETTPWSNSEAALKVDGEAFPALEDYTVKDPQSTFSTTEYQYIYVKGDQVHYDDDKSDFVAEQIQLAYEIEFDGSGIPVCSDSKSGYWAYCTVNVGANDDDDNTDKALENHRVKVKFLGEEWILSGIDIEEDTVKLAKESAYSPKLQIGESLDLGDGNKLVLGDLKPASGGQTADIAIFSVKDASGTEIASKTVAQGATTEIQAGSKTYRVRVYQVAPGYTLTEKWAEVAVFGQELELVDGEELKNNEDKWEVALTWENKDTNGGIYAAKTVDHLKKIQLKGIDYKDLYKGDYMTVVDDPAKFKLTFTGLDLTDKDYLKVSFKVERTGTTVYDTDTSDTDDAADRRITGDTDDTNKDTQISIKADEGIFTVFDIANKKFDRVSELLFSPVGVVNYSNKSQQIDGNWTMYFKEGSKYYLAKDGVNNYVGSAMEYATVPYKLGGDTFNMYIGIANLSETSTFGDVNWSNATHSSPVLGADTPVYIWFTEDIENSQTATFALRLVDKNDEDNEELVFDAVGSNTNDDDDQVWYDGEITTGTVDLPYYTERGTKLDGSKTSFTVNLAKKVGRLAFVLQTTGATETSANSYEQTLKEGEQLTLSDGTKVKVKAINCETGACTAGAGSVSGTDKVSCQVNANVANLGERQNIASDLVVLDSAFSGTETVIAVGGPAVNTVTKAIVSGTGVTFEKAGDVVVQEVETGKIVVAGYNAQDTLAAAQQFIAKLA